MIMSLDPDPEPRMMECAMMPSECHRPSRLSLHGGEKKNDKR